MKTRMTYQQLNFNCCFAEYLPSYMIIWMVPLLCLHVLILMPQYTIGVVSRWTNPVIAEAVGSGTLMPHVLEDTYGRTGIFAATNEPNATYFIVFQEIENLFVMNETSGEITIANGIATLDSETGPNSYQLIIWARGGNISEGTATATIIIRDLNDNVPTFEISEYSVVVSGGAVGGTPVVIVKATDADLTSPNNVIGYSILDGDSDKQFYIDQTSGLITVRLGKTINNTVNTAFPLVIGAIDQGLPARTGSVTVTVLIGKATKLFNDMQLGMTLSCMAVALFTY